MLTLHDKIYQAFALCSCILQVIKNFLFPNHSLLATAPFFSPTKPSRLTLIHNFYMFEHWQMIKIIPDTTSYNTHRSHHQQIMAVAYLHWAWPTSQAMAGCCGILICSNTVDCCVKEKESMKGEWSSMVTTCIFTASTGSVFLLWIHEVGVTATGQ